MRYRLITPHGVYAPGVILDTELPPCRPFSIATPEAQRLSEMGVMEAAEDPQLPRDDPGWSDAVGVSGRAQPRAAQAPDPPQRRTQSQSRRKG